MVWLSHGKQETPDQLYPILKQQMELAARALE
jgi:hypothetical protein